MITLPNGVKVPDAQDLVDPAKLMQDVAKSFSDAIGGLGVGKRQPKSYTVANQTEKTDLATTTPPINGDEVFVEDTAWWEMYDGAAWKVVRTTRPIAWPLAHTGINNGNGASNFFYSVSGDMITLAGSFTLGSSTTMPAGVSSAHLVLPFPTWINGSVSIIGTCSAYDASTGNHYSGAVVGTGTSPFTQAATMFDTATTAALAYLQSDQPFVWAAPDVLSLNLRWRRG